MFDFFVTNGGACLLVAILFIVVLAGGYVLGMIDAYLIMKRIAEEETNDVT